MTLATIFCLETVLVTSATAALKAGSLALGGLALDEHHLARLLGEAGVLEDRLGAAALAVERLRVASASVWPSDCRRS